MTEFNSPNLSFPVDLEFPLMRQAVLAELYCIDGPSSSPTKLPFIDVLPTKRNRLRSGIDSDHLSQQNEYLIHSFCYVILCGYELRRKYLVDMVATYLGFINVIYAFSENMKKNFRLARSYMMLYRNENQKSQYNHIA